nr:homeodomain-interacting protein kinase 3-like [Pseudochaenichthys georgianus]
MSQQIQVKKDDILSSGSANYLILDFIGEGSFGKVAKCRNIKSSKTIAIKIHKDIKHYVTEVRMLEKVRKLDPEKNNLVRFIEQFIFTDSPCLAFEKLDKNIFNFIVQRDKPLSLNEIRPISQQLLVAFEALKSIGIIHSDLKLDNIMLVDQRIQPLRIKLIDFGLSIPASEAKVGTRMQAGPYRSPEVYLGLPISEAIDMWSLGCVLGEMYLGNRLFCGITSYQVMKAICRLIGQPGDHLLNAGKKSSECFKMVNKFNHTRWRLKTPREYKKSSDVSSTIIKRPFDKLKSLDAAVEKHSKKNDKVEYEDRMAFLQLLKQLLDLDGNSRITPEQALTHSFVTMGHLKEDLGCSSYLPETVSMMNICTQNHSDASDVPVNNFMKSTDAIEEVSETESSSNADTQPNVFCQDPLITPKTLIADNSNLEKSEDLGCSSFLKEASRLMNICTLDHSEASDVPLNKTDMKSTDASGVVSKTGNASNADARPISTNSNDGAAAAIIPTNQGDDDTTWACLPKKLKCFQRVKRGVV